MHYNFHHYDAIPSAKESDTKKNPLGKKKVIW